MRIFNLIISIWKIILIIQIFFLMSILKFCPLSLSPKPDLIFQPGVTKAAAGTPAVIADAKRDEGEFIPWASAVANFMWA
jgi:hypothetical protein